MNFLGVGPMELVIVATLAYFLLGPKKMGEAGKTIGKILREFREQRDEFTSMLMESVDIEDKPKPPVVPSTPVGAVAQSGDPGDPDESGHTDPDPDKTADASASTERSEGADPQVDEAPINGSKNGAKQEKVE